jgi:hypothetical protein
MKSAFMWLGTNISTQETVSIIGKVLPIKVSVSLMVELAECAFV